ncbi:unnamed protein product [Spirodela intermedia]|uniref:Uncharacterized protein n=1 Tax=Spirodela intermedia TaxID=51605 RepID=A0A7I8K4U7_SPIIN|nr:unnamed protein product [Spirodela intermedia]
MGRRIVSGGCHPTEQKNGDFAALRRLSPDGEELDGGGARVRDLPICLGMIWSGYSMVLEINEMGRRIVSGGCHLVERKNGDFAALRWLSPDGEELDGGGARVRALHPQVRTAR